MFSWDSIFAHRRICGGIASCQTGKEGARNSRRVRGVLIASSGLNASMDVHTVIMRRKSECRKRTSRIWKLHLSQNASAAVQSILFRMWDTGFQAGGLARYATSVGKRTSSNEIVSRQLRIPEPSPAASRHPLPEGEGSRFRRPLPLGAWERVAEGRVRIAIRG